MTGEDETQATRREKELVRIQKLRERQKQVMYEDYASLTGVLRKDGIKRCCDDFGLITPLCEANLKPANYKLRIGDQYAINGEIRPLSDQPGQNEIRVEPFEVAIIKTLETVNMPPFLIGRWNIQVSKAYKGLLWVGGPQVDAGYIGNLFCPIYNLSDRPAFLHFGEPIAVLDFEKTSRPAEGEPDYSGSPDRLLFEDYEPELLQSGLARIASERLTAFERVLGSLTRRIDFFVTIVFTMLGILFAAGALFVTRPGSHPHWWNLGVFAVCVLAISLSGLAFLWAGAASARLPRVIRELVSGQRKIRKIGADVSDLKARVSRLELPKPHRGQTPD